MATKKNSIKNNPVDNDVNVDKSVDNPVDNDVNADKLLNKIKEQENIISDLKTENKNTNELMQKQMQDMQNAIIKMQINNNISNSVESKKYNIGGRLINGVTIYSPKREVERRIPYKETIEVNEYEIEMLLKTQFVKDFLRKDIIFFTDEENYEKFKIYDRLDLSDEKIINMVLKYTSNDLVNELNRLTRDKKDDPVVHSLFYRIVELDMSGAIARMVHENRVAIETYFKYRIENARTLIESLKKVQ